jgi:hypothetical protein
MPSDTNLLLYLALNSLSTFEFVELRYLYDIHMLIARSMKQEEWPEVLKKSRSWNLGCVLFFALALCQDLFNTPVPRDVLWQLRPHFLKRALLNIWINKRTILYHNQNIAASYTWRYFVSSYLYSRGILDCSRLMHKKIFLPAQEVMGFYHQPACGVSYRLYIKRLLKPITRYLRKGVVTHAKHAHLEKESQYCYTKN